MNYPTIRKRISRKDTSFYIRFYTLVVISVIFVIGFGIWLTNHLTDSYKGAMATCQDHGYTLEYCESVIK